MLHRLRGPSADAHNSLDDRLQNVGRTIFCLPSFERRRSSTRRAVGQDMVKFNWLEAVQILSRDSSFDAPAPAPEPRWNFCRVLEINSLPIYKSVTTPLVSFLVSRLLRTSPVMIGP